MIKLSNEQQKAFDAVRAFMKNDEQTFVLAGYAGTGKTTICKFIADEFESTIQLAYTGKAANVLREKGNYSSTIHSAIYKLIETANSEPKFVLDKDSFIKDLDLVIVDEFSMLPKAITSDLESLAKKILYLGDPFQLPPVNGTCFLKPDFFLEEIHRQSLESYIIKYATDIRIGKNINFCEHDDFVYKPKKETNSELYSKADQIIVGYNRTRTTWNNRFRKNLGFTGSEYPTKGDKLICLKNDHKIGLFNGMIGYATKAAKYLDKTRTELFFDNFDKLITWSGQYTNEPFPKRLSKQIKIFDYAYAITCHKAQGSQFNHVLIYNEPLGFDAVAKRRWLYTAITRGVNKVSLIEP